MLTTEKLDPPEDQESQTMNFQPKTKKCKLYKLNKFLKIVEES
jgi:hypothetical protein